MLFNVIRSKAPLRISFAGGGTDLHEYFIKYDGTVLNATINWYAYTSIYPYKGFQINSLDLGIKTEFDRDYNSEELRLVVATLKRYKGIKNGSFLLHSDAPKSSGLGGSSSVTVSLIGALNEKINRKMSKDEIADLACKIEREDIKIPGGYQDQYASVYGGINFIEFRRDGNIYVSPLRLDKEKLNELRYHMILVRVGERKSHNIINSQIKGLTDEDILEKYHRIKELAAKMKDALVKDDYRLFGELLGEEWEAKKSTAAEVSTSEIDEIYKKVKEDGVLGGKITGAGSGGHMLLFCKPQKRHDVEKKLVELGMSSKPFDFENKGLTTWRADYYD